MSDLCDRRKPLTAADFTAPLEFHITSDAEKSVYNLSTNQQVEALRRVVVQTRLEDTYHLFRAFFEEERSWIGGDASSGAAGRPRSRIGEAGPKPSKRGTVAKRGAPMPKGKIQLSFNRNAQQNYWYTYDADDNRNISRYDGKHRWSISVFAIMPRFVSTYEVTIHAVEAFAYNGHLDRWEELQDRVEIGFPGKTVERAVREFQKGGQILTSESIRPNESRILKIKKIGQFRASLSSEFNFKASLWGASQGSYYACL
jgi:hypothetical protein